MDSLSVLMRQVWHKVFSKKFYGALMPNLDSAPKKNIVKMVLIMIFEQQLHEISKNNYYNFYNIFQKMATFWLLFWVKTKNSKMRNHDIGKNRYKNYLNTFFLP